MLFSGEHHYLFQAAETVKKIKEDTRLKRELAMKAYMKSNSLSTRFLNMMLCRKSIMKRKTTVADIQMSLSQKIQKEHGGLKSEILNGSHHHGQAGPGEDGDIDPLHE